MTSRNTWNINLNDMARGEYVTVLGMRASRKKLEKLARELEEAFKRILRIECTSHSNVASVDLFLGNKNYYNPIFVVNESDAYKFSTNDPELNRAFEHFLAQKEVWYMGKLYTIDDVDVEIID